MIQPIWGAQIASNEGTAGISDYLQRLHLESLDIKFCDEYT